MNDVWVFSLQNLIWYEVNKTGSIPAPRFSHCAAIAGTSLVVFGGINKNFCNSYLFSLELDPYYSKKAYQTDGINLRINTTTTLQNDYDVSKV